MPKKSQLGLLLMIALFCATSVWFYVDKILVSYQIADADAHDRPRGNLSDLYPRWLGARELLLERQNPYSQKVSLEIQKGYYGRALDPTRPDDPKDQQGFAYPVYVVFLLAPLLPFPFHNVQIFFYWLLIVITLASVWLWLRALDWRLPMTAIVAAALLTLGSIPAVQGIKLQQLSLLVGALLAASAACISGGFLFFGGVLLAFATIKPQLAWPLAAWLLLWALSDWRTRRYFVYGFAAVMLLLLTASEILLPGWWRMFAAAIADYHRYTQNQSVLDVLLPGAFAGKIVALAAVLFSVRSLWKIRRAAPGAKEFSCALALVMALTVLIVPMSAPYNQILLVPALMVLLRDRQSLLPRSRGPRWLSAAVALTVSWQWITSLFLTVIYLLGASPVALAGWKWPFFTTFAIPVLVFALVALDAPNSIPIKQTDAN